MGICENCKYWDEENSDYYGFGNCNSKKIVNNENPETTEDDMMICFDDEGSVSFQTGRNFGCIHWQEKKV